MKFLNQTFLEPIIQWIWLSQQFFCVHRLSHVPFSLLEHMGKAHKRSTVEFEFIPCAEQWSISPHHILDDIEDSQCVSELYHDRCSLVNAQLAILLSLMMIPSTSIVQIHWHVDPTTRKKMKVHKTSSPNGTQFFIVIKSYSDTYH